MMQQPSGEPQMGQGYPPGGGLPPPATPPGGASFSGGAPDGGGYGPPGGGGYGPPGGGGYGPPGGGGFGGPPGGFGGPPGGGAPPGGFGGPPGGGDGGGGYGGPPGGGPPGGFGGPPGGGAPPGGFGGPPQGGFGGPPQGFGGPPGPGGYGPPQGGGYGPPMGGPMQQPPQKKSNVGMIIGIGCAGIFVLAVGAIVFSCYYAQKKAKEAAAALASAFPIDSTGKLTGDPFKDLEPAAEGSLKLEAKDVRWFKSSSMVTVVAEIENTGTAPVSYPSVKFTFFDASKTAIDSGTCSGTLSELGPGEKVPCSFLITKVKEWDSYKMESKPMKVYGFRKPAKLKITDTKFTPKKGWQPNKLEGKITNESAFKAKHITAVVGLYDKDGKVCGTGFASISGNELDPGTATTFSASIYETAAPPDTFKVLAMGSGD